MRGLILLMGSIALTSARPALGVNNPCGADVPFEQEVNDQCAQFNITQTMRSIRNATQPAEEACKTYFRKVYEGRDLICEYRLAAASFTVEAHTAALANSGAAAEASRGTGGMSERAREIYLDFAGRMDRNWQDIVELQRAYFQSLNRVYSVGSGCMGTENIQRRGCENSEAPGVLIVGVARRSMQHSIDVSRSAGSALQRSARALRAQATAINPNISHLHEITENLGSLVPAANLNNLQGAQEPVSESRTALTAPGVKRTISGTVGQFNRSSVRDTVKGNAEEGLRRATDADGVSTSDLLWAAWRLACRRTVPCWIAESAYREADHGSTIFRNFCRQQLTENPEITSAQIAEAWRAHRSGSGNRESPELAAGSPRPD